jgi:hypothetical protein
LPAGILPVGVLAMAKFDRLPERGIGLRDIHGRWDLAWEVNRNR